MLKNKKYLYSLIPVFLFVAVVVLAKVDTSLPLPAGAAAAPSAASEAVKQIYLLFQFGLGTIGIVAFGSIIYGAVKYMAAAGDPGAITEAKGRIFSALWGIGIALTSIMLLGTINPDLISFLGAGKMVVKVKTKEKTVYCSSKQNGVCEKDGEYCYWEGTAYSCMTPKEYGEKYSSKEETTTSDESEFEFSL